MGFFSFITSDTKKSIRSQAPFSGYILTPKKAIHVTYYDGFGKFTCDETGQPTTLDIFDFLVRQNFPESSLKDLDEKEVSMLGVKLSPDTNYYWETSDKRKALCSIHVSKNMAILLGFKSGDFLFPNYAYELTLDGYYCSISQHIEAGRLKKVPIKQEVELKIVENLTRYDQVKACESCPNQGLY